MCSGGKRASRGTGACGGDDGRGGQEAADSGNGKPGATRGRGHAKRTLEEARENAEREAREIITSSIQRVVRDYVSESTISVVPIPNDAMKGRIIGREGRNIRAIEAATGIDLIIDETPEAVIISGFDPLRREIAKVSLERLMHDGRIHPTRIEEIVEKVKVDIDKLMYEEAEKIIFELGLSDFHPELIKVLGPAQVPDQLRTKQSLSCS